MIIEALRRGLAGHRLYLRLDRQRIFARNVGTGEQFACRAQLWVDAENSVRSIGEPLALESTRVIQPFDHPRVLIDDYDMAEKLVQFAISTLMQTQTFATSPDVVMHADLELEGGLSSIEARALHEMAIHAGARRILIHEGEALTDDTVNAMLAEIDSV